MKSKVKTAVVVQSSYVPWKGYFDLVHDADVFVFYDDVQFTKNDWRNRNKIKTPQGTEWITVPVGAKLNRLVHEVDIKDASWQGRHWKTIIQNCARLPYFSRYQPFFEDVFINQRWGNLSELNQYLICGISRDLLGIRTEFHDSRDYHASGQKLDRLLDLLVRTGAGRYVSGPAAKDYIVPARFAEVGIELAWKDYAGYPEYPQRFPPFEHSVSILDLLFNVGPDAPWYIWGWREGAPKPLNCP